MEEKCAGSRSSLPFYSSSGRPSCQRSPRSRSAGTRSSACCAIAPRWPTASPNIALFLPLGIAMALANRAPRRAHLLAASLSRTVELAQLWIPGRDPSLSDLICNTLGAGLGGGMVRLARRWGGPGVQAASRLSLFCRGRCRRGVRLGRHAAHAFLAGHRVFRWFRIRAVVRPLTLGGNIEPQGYFEGRIDDVRIYRRARTAVEIRDDTDTPLSAAARSADLVAAYNFDEGTARS